MDNATLKTAFNANTSKLAWIMDALIPEAPDMSMPSATQAGVLDVHLLKVLTLRDDMSAAFFQIIEDLPAEEPAEPLEMLTGLPDHTVDAIGKLIAAAYFLAPEVREKIGYPGQEAMIEDPSYDETIEIIEPIMERGPIYTPVD